MNKTSKAILIIIVLIIIIGGVWYGTTRQPPEELPPETKETVKIGAILPLTGGSAHMGESCRQAMLLAKEQLKDTKYNYEILFEDDAMERVKTATALQKLINVDKVDVLISWSSGSGNVVSPVAEQEQIIHFGIASDPIIAEGKFNFLHWTPPESENEKFVAQLQKQNISKIAIIALNQEGFRTTINDLKPRFEQADIQIVYEAIVPPEQRDFKTEITKAKEAKPEILFIGFWPPQLEILGKQLRELAADVPLTSIEAFEYSEQPELFEGHWYVQAADPAESFVQDYQAKYGEAPQLSAANAYDIINLIVTAFENTAQDIKGKPSLENVISALQQIKDFPGALGKLSIPETGIVWSEASVRIIKDGKPVTISQ